MLPDKHVRNVYDDVIRCEVPPANLNSTNIFLRLAWGQTANISSYTVLLVLTAPKTQITKRLMMKEIKRAMPERRKRQ